MKLAGSRFLASGTVALTLLLAVLALSADAEAALQEEVVSVPAGSYYREEIFLPTDGSPWLGTVQVVNASARVDIYILRTTDVLGPYPNGNFAPLERAENVTAATLTFLPSNRFESYSLVVDNLDNARAADAASNIGVSVRLTRSPPVRTSSEAQALLSTGTGVCAASLAAGAVAVAIYLKRRPHPETDEAAAARPPRIEIDVPIPPPPKGVWAREAPAEREPSREEP